jgi:hypothetical protein
MADAPQAAGQTSETAASDDAAASTESDPPGAEGTQ